jgi:hypothetical protein
VISLLTCAILLMDKRLNKQLKQLCKLR